MGTLTQDPVIPKPTILGLIQKIKDIINYNNNNGKTLCLDSKSFQGIKGLSYTEMEFLSNVVRNQANLKTQVERQIPSWILIDYLVTLTENPHDFITSGIPRYRFAGAPKKILKKI